jgi:signal transduction histidine kinase
MTDATRTSDNRVPKPLLHKISDLLLGLVPLTFRGQAVLFLFPMLVIISLVYTVESITTERRILKTEIIKKGEAIAVIAGRSAELPLLSENVEQLKLSARQLMEIKDIAYVSFLNRQSRVLLHEGVPRRFNEVLSLNPDRSISFSEQADVFEFIVPVVTVKAAEELFLLDGSGSSPPVREQIGWVRIGLSKEVMGRSEQQIMIRGALLAVLFSSIGVLLLYLVVKLATRPLYALINAVKEVREGEHPEVPVVSTKSEIGKLTMEFNRMSHAIKEREDELIRHRDHLEDLVGERTAELMVAKEQAEAANRAKSDFLSSMSHELRTPLNAILGYAQILKHQTNLSDSQRQQLDIMRSSGEHLLMLINDILDVGKIEASKMEVEARAFDLQALVQQVFNLTRLQAEEKELAFSYEAETSLPEYVRGDERKLRQILLNLLSNAVKYTRRGSVVMRVRYDRTDGGLFHCEVSDTGIGIPADKLSSIFEPFTQLASGRLVSEGTGLGLNITRRLLELMQGRIAVESEFGRGSTFRIALPLPSLMDDEVAIQRTEQHIVGYQGERKRILLVDDTIGNTAMLVSLLEPLGFLLTTAQNGKEAVQLATAEVPDLVVLDLVMPEMDGLEVATALRQHPVLQTVKIIGASATVTDTAHKDEFVALCDVFITKPISIALLLEHIGAMLGITWEMASPARAGAAPELPAVTCDAPFVVPSPAELEELYGLAMMGDLLKIEVWATTLAARDSAFRPFAAKLRELAGGFKVKAIVALVEHYRGEGQ